VSDGLYAPRPLRLETETGRLVQALEDTPRHSMSVPRWVRLLKAFDADGYDPPTPPAAPARVLSRGARLAVLEARAERGQALFHEDDVSAAEDAGVGVLALNANGPLGGAGRQGEVALSTTLEEDEDAPEPWEVGEDVLSRCARAARDRTPPPAYEPEEAPAALPFVRPVRTTKPIRRAA
jgi:hypothetical protein